MIEGNQISIKRNLTIEDIDSLYRKLNSSKSFDDFNIIIPKEINNNQFGIHAELMLFYLSWFRKTQDACIILNIDSIEQNSLLEFINKQYNFLLVTIGFNRGIFNSNMVDIRQLLLPFIKQKIKEIENDYCWRRGDHSFIISIENSINPYVKSFYLEPNILRNKKWFDSLINHIVHETIQKNSLEVANKYIKNQLDKRIPKIIYELIENVNKWGRTDFNDRILKEGAFALLISNHSDFDKNLQYEESSVNTYIKSLNSSCTSLLEFSILDSGLGLASRYLETDITVFSNQNKIINAIYESMQINNSSDKSSAYRRGLGYSIIFELLTSVSGFLKIRTNGVKLYRNFKKDPYVTEDFSMDVYSSMKTSKITARNQNSGTLITFFIPIQ